MNTLNYIISKKIKQKRKELGVTGIEIAHSLEISQQHYSRIENGHTKITVDRQYIEQQETPS
ncbi:helix-turn-helix domain-containing protein [Proteus mirabilis]